MSNKKDDYDKLIQIALSDEELGEELSDIHKFIIELNVYTVPRGNGGVRTPYLYWVYKKWAEAKGIEAFPRRYFFKKFCEILNPEKGIQPKTSATPVSYYYFINKEPFKLDRAEQLQAFLEIERERWRKNNTPKKIRRKSVPQQILKRRRKKLRQQEQARKKLREKEIKKLTQD
jgi:hypothetical protein